MNSVSIVNRIYERLIEATMLHHELCSIFTYLGLDGFAKVHDYQYIAENMEMKQVADFLIKRLNVLPSNESVKVKNYVPDSLTGLSRKDVKVSDKEDAVASLIDMWITWETETVEKYSNWYVELTELHELDVCGMVMKLIEDVSKELKRAYDISVTLINVEYDMKEITNLQHTFCCKYKQMIKEKLHEMKVVNEKGVECV